MLRSGNILIVDDEKSIRQSLMWALQGKYNLFFESNAYEGIDCVIKNNIDIILLDIKMPGMDGLDALREIKRIKPLTEVIITAYPNLKHLWKAICNKAFDFIEKPFDILEVQRSIEKALTKINKNKALISNANRLDEECEYLEVQFRDLVGKTIKILDDNLMEILTTINSIDGFTKDHSIRVACLSEVIAKRMNLDNHDIEWIKFAAMVHDIGKVGINQKTLAKNGKLTESEYIRIQKHVRIGAELLGKLNILKSVVPAVQHHHENYDGTGYPNGLKGENIPLSARIISIAETVDSMLNSTYKKRYGKEEVKAELIILSGVQYDPCISDIVLYEDLVELEFLKCS